MTPILLDSDNLIKRCIMQTALEDLNTSGIFTGGIYGSLSMISSILTRFGVVRAGPIFAFFDCGIPDRRMKLIPEYKANRKEKRQLLTEEQLASAYLQLDETAKLLRLLGVITAKYRDREADDGIAAAVRVLVECGASPVVLSTDHDLWQVIGMGARVYNFPKDEWVDEENFAELTGVPPQLYVLFRGLVGDTSDGIKGIPGCGPKRAAELIYWFRAIADSDWEDKQPVEQWRLLVRRLRGLATEPKAKLKKFEQAILEPGAEERIDKALRGIDLSNSFGPDTGLRRKLGEPVRVQKIAFLRACKRWNFQKVLSDPARFLRPFERAQKVAERA